MLWPSGGGGGGILDRAAAAVTPTDAILELRASISDAPLAPDGSWGQATARTVVSRSLFEDGRSTRMRMVQTDAGRATDDFGSWHPATERCASRPLSRTGRCRPA